MRLGREVLGNMEQTHSYNVRYASKHIKTISAHSKWEAIDRVYNEYMEQYAWYGSIERRLLTATLNR
jgi:predicted metal-dependent hydrolase